MNNQNELAAQCVSECLIKAETHNVQGKNFPKFADSICRSYGFRDYDQTMELALVWFSIKVNAHKKGDPDFGWASFYKPKQSL